MGEECTGQAVSVGVCTCMLLAACRAVHTVQTSQPGDALRPIHQSINKTIRAGIHLCLNHSSRCTGRNEAGRWGRVSLMAVYEVQPFLPFGIARGGVHGTACQYVAARCVGAS